LWRWRTLSRDRPLRTGQEGSSASAEGKVTICARLDLPTQSILSILRTYTSSDVILYIQPVSLYNLLFVVVALHIRKSESEYSGCVSWSLSAPSSLGRNSWSATDS
jgi:hypothetical protein